MPTPPPAPRSASGFRRGRSKAESQQIAERLNDPATWERIKTEMRELLAERGLPIFRSRSWPRTRLTRRSMGFR